MPSDAEILIVDDHPGALFALESALIPLGRPLSRATSGDEALKQVLRGRVGLLVLDVQMPGMNGLEVVRYLRRLDQSRHIPVVPLTGFGRDPELTTAAFALGVADLIAKPVDPWALRTKIRYLYDAHQHRLTLEAEIRELRALVKGTGTSPPPAPRTAPPHPDARVPLQRDAQTPAPAHEAT
ncbi:response regulator [Streptomyces actuosus]|uniref:Response regulator n=1 Tax=Streptomyces actuosus TaxID=1885 RepID=A0ABS2VLH5_STRAS|nr:response regulator [Streptomyces actuosus]MBN0043959.1 response regulator [Streptomyces actuosus]